MAQIVLVEDNDMTLQLVYYLLLRGKHTVYKACNGAEAMSYINNASVDLVITDVYMPEMDGLALLDCIRSSEEYRHIPVIVMTASGMDNTQTQALEKGATAFLTHPFSSIELGKLVSDCVGVA